MSVSRLPTGHRMTTMKYFWATCFWLGIVSGVVMGFAGNLLQKSFSDGAAVTTVQLLGFTFLSCGLLLLLRAVSYVVRRWSSLSAFGRFLGTAGLLVSSVLGGFIFYWFIARQEDRTRP